MNNNALNSKILPNVQVDLEKEDLLLWIAGFNKCKFKINIWHSSVLPISIIFVERNETIM